MSELPDHVFGPVPSRRLGKSLGINNIPAKVCSYSCVYCQLGRTIELSVRRRSFYDPEELVKEVREKLETYQGKLDYITFVPDGEPTLDENLGVEVKLLREITDIPIAILTNASLIFLEKVREDLMDFDLVSLKVDAISKRTWIKINRPHPSLSLDEILKGIRSFSKEFSGRLITETMLIDGVNSTSEELKGIADFLSELKLDKAYLAIPTRPPAEKWVKPVKEEDLVQAYEIFAGELGADKVELLTGYEGSDFYLGGDPAEALLAILAVHPMRLDYAEQAISRFNRDPKVVIQELISEGKISLVEYHGRRFLVRKLVKQ